MKQLSMGMELQNRIYNDILSIVKHIKENKNEFVFEQTELNSLDKKIEECIARGTQCNEHILRFIVDKKVYALRIASANWTYATERACYGWGNIIDENIDSNEREYWRNREFQTHDIHARFVLHLLQKDDDSSLYSNICCFGDKATYFETNLNDMLDKAFPKDKIVFTYEYNINSDSNDTLCINTKIKANNLQDAFVLLDEEYMSYEIGNIQKVKSEKSAYSFVAKDNKEHKIFIERTKINRK